ncbi:MAG: MOSC domain-containing protein [Chloroflexi bacterium]|nr:MOSC domain-containing protein [Chloroflexota bacterium]
MSSERTATAHVVGLFVASESRAPVEARDDVMLVAGVGIEGDRYATGRGFWSDPQWPDQELTFVEAEVAEELGIEPSALRRNVVVRGVRLDDLIGAEVAIGEALIAGVRPCDPCAHIEHVSARPGLLKALVGRGGLRARIVRGGRVRVGDAITIVRAAQDQRLDARA